MVSVELFQRLLNALVQRRGLIVFCVVFAIVTAAILAMSLRHTYSVTAQVLSGPGSLQPSNRNANLADALDRIALAASSEALLVQAMDRAGLVDGRDLSFAPQFNPAVPAFFRALPEPATRDRRQLLDLTRHAISVSRSENGGGLLVTATTMSPDLSELLANAMVAVLVEQVGTHHAALLQRIASLVADRTEHIQYQLASTHDLVEASTVVHASTVPTLEAARQHHHQLVQRSAEIEAEMQLSMPGNATIAAGVANNTGFPSLPGLLVAASLSGLAVGIAVAIILDLMMTGIRSRRELARLAGTSLTIGIPQLDKRRSGETSHADQVARFPSAPFTRAMRRLRSALQHQVPTLATGRVVVVTGTCRTEDKTITALGLARSYAGVGKRVLLLDADPHAAALRRQVSVPLSVGLEEILKGTADMARVSDVLRRDPLSDVSILANAGTVGDHAVSDAALVSLLRAVQKSFDVLVVDLPPAGSAVSAAQILGLADAVVVVARWGQTQRCSLEMTLAMIAGAGRADVPVIPVLMQRPRVINWPFRLSPGYAVG